MKLSKKTGQILLCPVPMLLNLLLQTNFGAACILILSLHLGVVSGEAFFTEHYMVFATGMQLISLVLVSVTYYALFRVSKPFPRPKDHISVKSTLQLLTIGLGLYCSTSLLVVSVYFIAPGLMQAYEEMVSESGFFDLTLLSAITTLILAPISEELLFRGITHRLAYRAFGSFRIANVIQAFLFGIAHLNLVQALYAFVLGLFLGYVCRRCRTLYAGILVHASFNFCGTYLPEFLGSISLPEPIVALFLFGIGIPVSYHFLTVLQPKYKS